jgi:hypothetical protein
MMMTKRVSVGLPIIMVTSMIIPASVLASTCGPPLCAEPLEELSPEELERELDNSNRDYPECDGSYQACVTDEGYFCDAGSSSHQCEMDKSTDNVDGDGNGDGIDDSNTPYCDEIEREVGVTCWDRKDYSEDTGLYPCRDGSYEENWQDCD